MFLVSLWAMINTEERTLRESLCVAFVEVTKPYSGVRRSAWSTVWLTVIFIGQFVRKKVRDIWR